MKTKQSAVAFAMWAVAFSAFGHGDEDHGAPRPIVTQNMVPRAAAATDEFELVAALEGRKLMVYLDRFASNEPVRKAKVEVEGAGLKGAALEAAPGVYVMDVVAPLPPGRHPLTIAIEAGQTSDLISASLDIAAPAADVGPVPGWRDSVVWIVLGALLLGAGVRVVRRKMNSKGT